MVAVLITDLVGSTGLMATLGREAFGAFLQDHFAGLRDVLGQTGGREIKTLGDGLLATFPSATDAVAAAVAMQQDADRRRPAGGDPIAIRVGLAAGEVTEEDGDVLGVPVVEAARLAAAARGGQILAADVVRMVCDDPEGTLFREVGEVSLKGLPGPVAAFEVVWAPQALSSVPMPAFLTDTGGIFVGRGHEVDRLAGVLAETGGGELRLALLAGEPGVGKTRLAAETAGRAHRAGSTVLAGRCDEDLPVPYQPFVEALRHFADHTPDHDLGGRLGRYGGELVRLLPELARRAPGFPSPLRSDPETEQYRLFDAVAGWLAAASADRSVVLVVDDLQWAAKPSLLLLRHLLRAPGLGRVAVVGTYRDSEVTHDHPLVGLLADLRRHSGVTRLSVGGLGEAEVVDFVEQAAGRRLAGEGVALARAVHAETQGNPFFVLEVLRHLVETGAVVVEGGRWRLAVPIEEVGIPEGVREVVGRRLARLSADANTVLRIAAVTGTEFDAAVVVHASDLDEEAVLSAVEEAQAARLLVEQPGPATAYRFSHALVRATVYEGLSAARRVVLHRRVGESLETLHRDRLDEHLPALAHHYAEASTAVATGTKAFDYAVRAGDRAAAQSAHHQAAVYYRQALELLEIAAGPADETRRLDLLMRLGVAQRLAGDAQHRTTLLAAGRLAQALGDAENLARSALANHRGLWAAVGGVDQDRVAMLEAALAAQEAVDSAVRARLMANLAVEVVYGDDPDRGRRLSADALAMSRRLGDGAVLADVLRSRIIAIWAPVTVRQRLAYTAELLEVARGLEDPMVACIGNWHRFVAAMEAGDVAEADRCLDAAGAVTAELGQPTARWFTSLLRACRLLVGGQVAASVAEAQEGLEIGLAAGHADATMLHAVQMFNVCFELGSLGSIAADVVRAAAANPGVTSLQATLAVLHAELDQLDQARAVYQPLLERIPSLRPEPYWLRTVTQAAYACHRLGDQAGAERLLALLAPFDGQSVCTGLSWGGAVSHYVGLLEATLGRHEDADASLARAEAAYAAIPAPTWVARTQLARAGLLLERGRPADGARADALLQESLATARRLGLATVERRVAQAMGAA